MSDIVEPQTDAIEDDPLHVVVSETTRIIYGKSVSDGRTLSSAFSARRPCPTSRRPTHLSGFTSPTENGGKL